MDEPRALAGFGGSVTGGGGSPQHTFTVTNLDDNGDGSFRAAVEAANGKDPVDTKLISIEVEGVTQITSPISLTADNCTITGRNAPGVGWALAGTSGNHQCLMIFSGTNVLLDHLRLYRGTSASTGGNAKALICGDLGAARHCSFMCCTDNMFSLLDGARWTFSYCLFALPLHNNHHTEDGGQTLQAHGYGPLAGSAAPNARCTLHMCASAHMQERMPLRFSGGRHELVGCLSYGWGSGAGATAITGTGTRANVQGSVWMAGSYTSASSRGVNTGATPAPDDNSLHISSDCIIQRPNFSRETGWAVAGLGSAGSKCTNTPHDYSGETGWTQPEIPGPTELGALVLPHVGALLPVRSYLDQLVIDQIRGAWEQDSHAGVIVDCVFKNGDPNTNSGRTQSTAPLTNFAKGAGWMEALDGRAVEPDDGTEVVAIARGSDDIMENTGDGSLIDGDQLLFRNARLVGLRFLVPSMPQGVNIISAHVQLTAGKVGKGANTTTWFCEVLDTGTFSGAGNVTGRTKTAASVAWPIAPWPTAGARGAAQKSPDLKTLVQEAVNHGSFAGGVVFLVTIGSGAPGDRNAAGFGHAQMAPAEVTIVWEKA